MTAAAMTPWDGDCAFAACTNPPIMLATVTRSCDPSMRWDDPERHDGWTRPICGPDAKRLEADPRAPNASTCSSCGAVNRITCIELTRVYPLPGRIPIGSDT